MNKALLNGMLTMGRLKKMEQTVAIEEQFTHTHTHMHMHMHMHMRTLTHLYAYVLYHTAYKCIVI